MDLGIAGRTAVVCASTSGLGEGVARALGAEGAIAGYLKTLATEVAADGVTVNLLLPGRMHTARITSIDSATAERTGRTEEEVRAEAAAAIPMRRYGNIEEFGAVGAFLCSALASYVTGTAVRCDGGTVGGL